jgi:hypothetical protein
LIDDFRIGLALGGFHHRPPCIRQLGHGRRRRGAGPDSPLRADCALALCGAALGEMALADKVVWRAKFRAGFIRLTSVISLGKSSNIFRLMDLTDYQPFLKLDEFPT